MLLTNSGWISEGAAQNVVSVTYLHSWLGMMMAGPSCSRSVEGGPRGKHTGFKVEDFLHSFPNVEKN